MFEHGTVGGRERHPGAEAVADLHFQRRLGSKRSDRDRERERLPGDDLGRACGLGQSERGGTGVDVGRDVSEVVGGVGVWSGGADLAELRSAPIEVGFAMTLIVSVAPLG